jgi:hypothetical protein
MSRDQSYERRMITVENAYDAALEVAFEACKSVEVLRLNMAVPNPTSALALGGAFNKLNEWIWRSEPMTNGFESLAEKRHPEWLEDWLCKGWLDDQSERSVSSPCGINPYCWTGFIFCICVAFRDLIDSLEDHCYEKNNGKPSPNGPVRTTKFHGKPARNRGNQPKAAIVGPVQPAKPRGRPKKQTKRTIDGVRRIFNSAKEARHGDGRRGRPPGKKDSVNSARHKAGVVRRRSKRGNNAIVIGPGGLPVTP